MKSLLTVIIPSYNGGSKLKRCLSALARQTSHDFSIILVDSCSTDQSIVEAVEHWNTLGSPMILKVIREERKGAQAARLRGAVEAETDLLIFCDDDNLLRPNYVESAIQLAKQNPHFGFIGGFGVPLPEEGVELPPWFPSVGIYFAAGGVPTNLVRMKEIIGTYTAGLVARKAVFDKLNNACFDPILKGRIGNSLIAGEDIELCKAARLANFITYQDSRLVFDHIMTKSRLTRSYVTKLCFAMGVARCRHRVYDYFINSYLREKYQNAWASETRSMFKPFLKSILSLIRIPDASNVNARVQISYMLTLLRERKCFEENLVKVHDFMQRLESSNS